MSDPRLGPKIADGASAEVFEWDGTRALKLFRAKYQYAVDMEAERAGIAAAAHLPCPAVHGIVTVDDRRGIVFDRLQGPTLLELWLLGERTISEVGRELAALHRAVHAVDARFPPAPAEVLGVALPPGSVIFHGDFHPGNIVMTDDGPKIVDWVNALRSQAAADVARSLVLMRHQLLFGAREIAPDEREVRNELAAVYVNEYEAGAPGALDNLPFWLGVHARLLLHEQPANPDAPALHALIAAGQ